MKWEVRTMRSVTSCFNWTIFRKTFLRFWPLWAANLVFWLFVLPLNGLVQLANYISSGRDSKVMLRFAQNLGEQGTILAVIFGIGAGLLVAMAVCSFMYNNRSANFMASLPIRREGMFVSTYLAGLVMLLAPNVLIFILTLLVEVAAGMVFWTPLLFWLAALSGAELFFYSFAVCLAQFSGHILAVPVYYGVFNCIALAVYSLISAILDTYYFGFHNTRFGGSTIAYWLTPAAALWEVDIDSVTMSMDIPADMPLEEALHTFRIENLWVTGVYAVIGVVLAICALLLYRRRHMETAGDIVAVKVMRPVFKYGVSVCAGLALGIFSATVLSLGDSEPVLMAAILIWGIIGYFVAQMLLDKSFRVFKKWKGAAAVTAAFLIMFAFIAFDVTGYESRVPVLNEVESVEISGLTAYPWDAASSLYEVDLTDPDDIAKVIALHEAIVNLGENGEADGDSYYTPNTRHMSFTVYYTLKNGKVLTRKYGITAGNTLLALAQEIRNDYDVRYQSHDLDLAEEIKSVGGYLDYATYYGNPYDGYNGGKEIVDWERRDAERLWTAVMADFEAGRIGMKSVYSEDKGDITTINFCWVSPVNKYEQSYNTTIAYATYVEFGLVDSATETWKVLNELLDAVKIEYTEEDLLAGLG